MAGVIAAGDPVTAESGAKILKNGGNAVDAAVAAAFVSFIAEIGVVHLGGSGMAQLFKPDSVNGPTSITYDFFSAMPGLNRELSSEELDFEKITIDFGPTTQEFYLGRGSVAVPGNIPGLCQLALEHGRLPLNELLEPAIQLARKGHQLAPFQAETCKLLQVIYTHTEDMREIFVHNGQLIQAGQRLFIPHLENTLQDLALDGSAIVRGGHLAKTILADQSLYGGLLTQTDLDTYQVQKIAPISLPYRDYLILLPPPSSTGGVLTAFTLKILCNFELGQLEHGSADYLRLLFEVMAATTRARPFWDKAMEELPAETAISYFLADSFVSHYVKEVKEALSGNRRFPTLSEPSLSPDTSHISVIDGDGLAVSLTTTAGESAGFVVPGTGYIPNNILGEADLHPTGFHSRPAGQRIPTMMTPTIVLKDGKIRAVVGSGGSIRIRSAILQVLTNLLDYRMRLVDAVNTHRIHLEDNILQCEHGFDPVAVKKIEDLGYPVNRWDKRSIYFGGAHTVSRTEKGRLIAAGDNRRGGAVAKVK